jgi:serine protease inhibitor
MTTIFIGGEKDILYSHFMNKEMIDILVWGNIAKEATITFDEWIEGKTSEEIKEMIDEGIHPNIVSMINGKPIKLLE